MFVNELKNRPTKQFVLSALLITFAIFNLTEYVPAEASKASNFETIDINPTEIPKTAHANNTKADPNILCREVKTVTAELSKSKSQNLLKQQMITQAREDLSKRLAVGIDQIKLLEARDVTWPDTSFGCPQPGKVYSQVLQDGLLIRLETGGRMYFYHGAGTAEPFLCEETSQVVPHPSKGDEFVPPPGSEID